MQNVTDGAKTLYTDLMNHLAKFNGCWTYSTLGRQRKRKRLVF